MDEVALYKRVLTAAERTWLHNNGAGRTYTEVNPSGTASWSACNYTYSTTIPHAVTSVNRISFTDSFAYDANGNMTCRTENGVTYIQTYSAENRIASIQKLASGTCAAPSNLTAKWDFTYDGDGVRRSKSQASRTRSRVEIASVNPPRVFEHACKRLSLFKSNASLRDRGRTNKNTSEGMFSVCPL